MQSAPRVESGEVSTRWEPTLIAEMMEIASPPVNSTKPGVIGRNIGIITPEELEYAEITAGTNAVQKQIVVGPATEAIISTRKFRPPALSITSINTDTPQTIMITDQGITLTAALESP